MKAIGKRDNTMAEAFYTTPMVRATMVPLALRAGPESASMHSALQEINMTASGWRTPSTAEAVIPGPMVSGTWFFFGPKGIFRLTACALQEIGLTAGGNRAVRVAMVFGMVPMVRTKRFSFIWD